MVNERGQLYTIEGVAAAILMVVTAYLVISSTTILTPQDVHIIDMQLQQLGNDALAVMDTPDQAGEESNLSRYVNSPDGNISFHKEFLDLINSTTGDTRDRLKYNASVFYWDPAVQTPLNFTFGGDQYYRENAVKVTRWVYIENPNGYVFPELPESPHSVLLEVLLWR